MYGGGPLVLNRRDTEDGLHKARKAQSACLGVRALKGGGCYTDEPLVMSMMIKSLERVGGWLGLGGGATLWRGRGVCSGSPWRIGEGR
jgi:hypothetical protein